ncbi:MAG: DUF58 domain-containing protein [Phycisphaerales bacterium]|nr:DUF58 domain-containing protein [Planctomycetota bacterium]MCH8508668.1 DUF58 domain-containing protein [Phycisphaerales bacterium]
MLTEELMREVKRLEIRSRRRVDQLLGGQYHSVFKGQGIEFADVREYQPGDEVRWIDWNVTARTGVPFVKRFSEERQLTVILAVDAGLTSAFGTSKSKLRLSAEVGAVLAMAAARNNDLVGLHLIGARDRLHLPPGKGRTHTLRVLRELLGAEPAERPSELAEELDELGRSLKRRAVVFLISDLLSGLDTDEDREPSWARPLRMLARKHEVIALTVEDPRENALPDVGMLRMVDPVTGRRVVLDTSSRAVRARYTTAAARDHGAIDRALGRARVDRVRLATDRPFGDDLARYLSMRERRA